jgi:hypothetical protein
MFVHLQGLDQFDLAGLMLHVDCSVGSVQPHRSLLLAPALQRFIVKAFTPADLTDSALLDQGNPDPELANDDVRYTIQLLVNGGKRYLIIDRDPLYTAAFRGILKGAGVKAVRLPAKSPNPKAYAERFVLSIKRERDARRCHQATVSARKICSGAKI